MEKKICSRCKREFEYDKMKTGNEITLFDDKGTMVCRKCLGG